MSLWSATSSLRSTTLAGKSIYIFPFIFNLSLPRPISMIEWIKMLLLCLRLGSNPQSAELVNAEVVTKRETLTIGEIFSYIKQESNKVRLGLIIS